MMLETGSSNRGHGICCKPNATEGICSGDDGIHECSMPVSGNDTDPELHDILTESPNGLVNHQMFAFCPMTSQATCGIPKGSSESLDMTLMVTSEKQTFKTEDLQYKWQGLPPSERRYQSCFYELQVEDLDSEMPMEDGYWRDIIINFKNLKGLNVYVYGGDRYWAWDTLVENNEPAHTDYHY